jgi:hypothetical protein
MNDLLGVLCKWLTGTWLHPFGDFRTTSIPGYTSKLHELTGLKQVSELLKDNSAGPATYKYPQLPQGKQQNLHYQIIQLPRFPEYSGFPKFHINQQPS